MNVYVSTSYLEKDRAKNLAWKLKAMGHTITCEWWDLTLERGWDYIAHKEASGVATCDTFVLLLPGRFGAHTEFGIALGMGKSVIIVGAPEDTEEMGNTCVFYHHPLVRHLRSESDLLEALP